MRMDGQRFFGCGTIRLNDQNAGASEVASSARKEISSIRQRFRCPPLLGLHRTMQRIAPETIKGKGTGRRTSFSMAKPSTHARAHTHLLDVGDAVVVIVPLVVLLAGVVKGLDVLLEVVHAEPDLLASGHVERLENSKKKS